MAENVKGPIGVNTLHREKLSCPENEDDGEESILRVISRKSVNSAVTIVPGEEDDRGLDPGVQRAYIRSHCL